MNAATRNNQGALCGANPCGGAGKRYDVGPRARNVPRALEKEIGGEVKSLGLHIFGQRQGDGARVLRAGEDAHGLGQGGDDLLRAVDAIPIARNGAERVVGRKVLRTGRFDLLEYGCDVAAREDVTGQEQHGQPVDGSGGRAGDHVGRARAD